MKFLNHILQSLYSQRPVVDQFTHYMSSIQRAIKAYLPPELMIECFRQIKPAAFG